MVCSVFKYFQVEKKYTFWICEVKKIAEVKIIQSRTELESRTMCLRRILFKFSGGWWLQKRGSHLGGKTDE